MSLTPAIHESLPYIDTEPTPPERLAAQALIDAELPPNTTQTTHPHLPPLAPALLPTSTSSSPPTPLTAIDTARYEALAPPTASTSLPAWQAALAQAHTSATYLGTRTTALHLLDEFGRNAWLVANGALEDELRALETELAARKEEIDRVVVARRRAQEEVGGELKGLEEAWRRGVGRVVETEIAAEGVRREILERRRGGGV